MKGGLRQLSEALLLIYRVYRVVAFTRIKVFHIWRGLGPTSEPVMRTNGPLEHPTHCESSPQIRVNHGFIVAKRLNIGDSDFLAKMVVRRGLHIVFTADLKVLPINRLHLIVELEQPVVVQFLVGEHHAATPTVYTKDVIRLGPYINPESGNRRRARVTRKWCHIQSKIDIHNLVQIRLSTRLTGGEMTGLKRKREIIEIPIHPGGFLQFCRRKKGPEDRGGRCAVSV